MSPREVLHKRETVNFSRNIYRAAQPVPEPSSPSVVPEIRFDRPDATATPQEVLSSPIYDGSDYPPIDYDREPERDRGLLPSYPGGGGGGENSPPRNRLSLFRRSRSPSDSATSTSLSPRRVRGERRLSQLLHLDRGNASSRSSSHSSLNIPADLPQIDNAAGGDEQDRQAQWEKRATLLVQQNPRFGASGSNLSLGEGNGDRRGPSPSRSLSTGRDNDPGGDANIHEAIRLHEAGELEASTKMFGRLADSNGADNALSQVLYGLALRHGWGCAKDPERAVSYLTAAASNSASIESEALRAGVKKGGSAKGELVLAMYELANCFRNGWGVEKDPAAARQYYETAANLGDTDAMNEAAWCYLEGFGGKKDKFTAAKYYRLAEENGNKTLGNSWIWKDKYTPK